MKFLEAVRYAQMTGYGKATVSRLLALVFADYGSLGTSFGHNMDGLDGSWNNTVRHWWVDKEPFIYAGEGFLLQHLGSFRRIKGWLAG